MGSIEDSRKAVQDLLAPDLKALTARLEALEREMHPGFAHAEKTNLERLASLKNEMASGFAHAEKTNLERLASLKNEMSSGFSDLEKGFAHAEFASASARHDAMLTIMAANHASIMNTLGSKSA